MTKSESTMTAPQADPAGPPPHAPELYMPTAIAEGVQGFDGVDDAAIRHYQEQGYIVIHNAFTANAVDAAKAGLADLIAGDVIGFDNIEYEAGTAASLEGMTPEERRDAVRKLTAFTSYEPRLNALAAHPDLVSVLACVLGKQPLLFQDIALLKPPHIGREKPWHQDHAFFNVATGTPVVGVWIALDEATVENGCMHLMPGEHRQGPILHFQRRDFQICDTLMHARGCVAAELKPGSLLLFDGMLPHGTPANRSDLRRRALQFHYVPQDTWRVSTEERLAVFGSEGKNATC